MLLAHFCLSALLQETLPLRSSELPAAVQMLPCVPLPIFCYARCCYVCEAAGVPLTCLHSLSTSGQVALLSSSIQHLGKQDHLMAAAGG